MSSDRPAESHPAYVPAQLVTASPSRKKGSGFGVLLFLFLFLGLGASFLLNFVLLVGRGSDETTKVEEKHFSHARGASNKVAVLNVDGVILDGNSFVKRQIDQVLKDKDVKAVVLRVDSPGGTVSGSDYIYHHLRKMLREREIPLVVSMGSIAASGGYYVSMAVGDTPDSIFAEPTTWTGSIGVIIPHYDASKLMEENLKIRQDAVVSHPLKGMGSFTKSMSTEERKILQSLVDESFCRFKEIIKQGRPRFRTKEGSEALDALATGQVYTAQQAVDKGLVDKVGFVEEAVDRAIELSGLAKEDVHVVEYKREISLRDIVLGSSARAETLDPAQLLGMTTPRSYYLWSWLPPVFSATKPD